MKKSDASSNTSSPSFKDYLHSRWGRNAAGLMIALALSLISHVEMAQSLSAPMLALLGVFGGVLIGIAGVAVNSLTTLVDLYGTQLRLHGMSKESVKDLIDGLQAIVDELRSNVIGLFVLLGLGLTVHLSGQPILSRASSDSGSLWFASFMLSFIGLGLLSSGFIVLYDTASAMFTVFKIRSTIWLKIIEHS